MGFAAPVTEPIEIVRDLERRIAPVAHHSVVAVFVLDKARGRLYRHMIADGRELPTKQIETTDFESNAARVLRELREIYIESEVGGRPATRVPGTQPTLSQWFGPLIHEGNLLGVLSVQSPRLAAYGERERAHFRLLAYEVAHALARR